jgi:hypothetical protein
MSSSVMRVPRMTGLPSMTFGLISMRSRTATVLSARFPRRSCVQVFRPHTSGNSLVLRSAAPGEIRSTGASFSSTTWIWCATSASVF